jgi:hypothetical protein
MRNATVLFAGPAENFAVPDFRPCGQTKTAAPKGGGLVGG